MSPRQSRVIESGEFGFVGIFSYLVLREIEKLFPSTYSRVYDMDILSLKELEKCTIYDSL